MVQLQLAGTAPAIGQLLELLHKFVFLNLGCNLFLNKNRWLTLGR
jgi:hypothetical protein